MKSHKLITDNANELFESNFKKIMILFSDHSGCELFIDKRTHEKYELNSLRPSDAYMRQ